MNIDSVLELMRKYEFSSTTVPPYLFVKGNTVGLYYAFTDLNYGYLERVKYFDDMDQVEMFLKKFAWIRDNGEKYKVRMVLDNYEIINPKIMFLRDEKIMVKGEMEDIDGFEAKKLEQEKLDRVSRLILTAGNLLLIYDEIKNNQISYFTSITGVKNELRTLYYELQKEIDKYNGVTIERELKLLPDVADNSGINQMMEVANKDKYNQYLVRLPDEQEAEAFVRDVWNLIMNLELNSRYYQAQYDETNIRGEMRVVQEKIDYIKGLNEEDRTFFKEDIMAKFKKINKKYESINIALSDNYIQEKLNDINNKYSYFDKVNIYKLPDYLKEAMKNTNYLELVEKYTHEEVKDNVLSLNEIIANLVEQFNKLTPDEQAILTLYNSEFKVYFDMILNIPGFENLSPKEIANRIAKDRRSSKAKSICFDLVKKRLEHPINKEIKSKIFDKISFFNYNSFIESIVRGLKLIKNINNKMYINSAINLYFFLEEETEFSKKFFLSVTNNINSLYKEVDDNNDIIGIARIKENTPVLYSPYTLSLGDIYSKDNVRMAVNNNTGFDLLIDTSDTKMLKDNNKIVIANYVSKKENIGDVSVVTDITLNKRVLFNNVSIGSNLVSDEDLKQVLVETQEKALDAAQAPLIAGVNAPAPKPTMPDSIVPNVSTTPVSPEPASVENVQKEEVKIEPKKEVEEQKLVLKKVRSTSLLKIKNANLVNLYTNTSGIVNIKKIKRKKVNKFIKIKAKSAELLGTKTVIVKGKTKNKFIRIKKKG
jgi:hypothetical protein